MPIPFIQHIDETGTVRFRREDLKRVETAAKKKLCQACGKPLDALIVFIGGETAVRQRLFRQAPFHEQCARVAMRLCPYLSKTADPHFMVWCRRYEWGIAHYPADPSEKTGFGFVPKAIVRITPIERFREAFSA